MTIDLKNLYSDVVKNIQPSPIDDLFRLINKPGLISFAGGLPSPETFHPQEFYQASSILKEDWQKILQYGAIEGYKPLMTFLSKWLAPKLGREVDRKEMLITTGSSQCSDLLVRALLNKGDSVVTEESSFMGNTINMANHGAKFITVPIDGDGMIVDLLPPMLERAKRAGEPVKFIYTIPNFHNPTGATLSLPRRKKLVQIAQDYSLILFEDDPYGDITFQGQKLPTLYSLDDQGVVLYAGSFSKILAPGPRVAWAVGPTDLLDTMATLKQAVDTGTSVVAQALVYQYCANGNLDKYLPSTIENYKTKRDLMEQAFQKHLPKNQVEYTMPQGGFFYWLTTPNIKTQDLFPKAFERNVLFVPGAPFYPNGGGQNSFRMCYTFATQAQIETGIKALGEAMAELLSKK